MLLRVRSSRAALTPRQAGAEHGSVIDIDMTSSLDSAARHDRFVLGEGKFMPGFEDKLIGAKTGNKLSFQLIAPADYWREDLRGRTIDFAVTVNGVFDRAIPLADDAFARSLGKIANLAELTNNIKEGIIAEKRERTENAAAHKMIREIVDSATADIPDIMVSRLTERDAKLDTEDAAKRAKMHIVIDALAERENARPAEGAVEQAIAHYHAGSKGQAPIDADALYGYIYERIQQENLYAKLLGTDRH
jgi:trigger factor